MRDDLGANLDRRLRSAATSFREGPAGRIGDPARLSVEARRWLAVQAHAEDEVLAVRTSDGQVLSTSGGLDLEMIDGVDDLLGASEARWWTVDGPGDGRVRALTVPLVLEGEPSGTLLVAATTTAVERTADRLLSAVAWASGLGLAFAVALAFISVRRTLGPLSRMAAEIDAIEPRGELPTGLAATVDAAPGDEVSRVADAFDSLLGRIDEAIASQRRFISDASHELRTPLTVARGHLELVGRLDDADADRSIQLALDELDRIRSIVEELLLLARLDEGLPMTEEPVEVDLLLREACVRGMALGRGEIEVDAPDGLTAVADPDRLLQVVSNLVGNALRHGGEGVTITLAARPEGRRDVVIDVADTGPGIAPADLDHVFDRFYRGSAARQGVPGGSGLGLAIVASLVEAMGGSVSATSTVGAGTTFSIRLRAVPSADAPPPAPEGAGGGSGQGGEPSGRPAAAPDSPMRVSGRRGG
jgi:signal transduction histidine kinase